MVEYSKTAILTIGEDFACKGMTTVQICQS